IVNRIAIALTYTSRERSRTKSLYSRNFRSSVRTARESPYRRIVFRIEPDGYDSTKNFFKKGYIKSLAQENLRYLTLLIVLDMLIDKCSYGNTRMKGTGEGRNAESDSENV